MLTNDDYEDVKRESAAHERAKRRYCRRMMAHPDPMDPDHPEPEEDPDYEGEEE